MMKKTIWLFAVAMSAMYFAQTTKYIVKKGDTTFSIAKKYGMSLDELYKLNPNAKNGNISIGSELKVKGNSPQKEDTLGYIILKPKQTIYGITKQYRISEEQLRKLNPDLDNQMKIGARVTLPESLVKKYADSDAQNAAYELQMQPSEQLVSTVKTNPVAPLQTYNGTSTSEDNYITYTVQSGDTTFGIVNKFGLSLDELIARNPSLAEGLKAGMVLKLRKAEKVYAKKKTGVLNVVFMLPFGYEENETKYRAMSVDFLSGAKIAIEKNAKRGMKMNINVIDAGSETSFKKALRQINKDNTDLIVGPFFKSNVIETLDFVKDDGILLVAPFANSEDLYGYNNLVIVETNERFYADKMVEEVKKAYKNQKIFIVGSATAGQVTYIKNELSKTLSKAEIVIVSSSEQIQADTNMLTGKTAPILALLTTQENGAPASFTQKILSLSTDNTGHKAFSMVYDPIFEKKSDELSAVDFVYFMDRKINTQGSVEKEILADFSQKYCKTPSKYAIIGFDVVNDLLTRDNGKGNILSNMSKEQTQLATKFDYQRVQKNGAFVNTAFRIIRLTRTDS